MNVKNYLPQAFNALMNWLVNFTGYLNTNLQRFGIAEAELNSLNVLIEAFSQAHAKAELPNAGKADRLDRREKAYAVTKAVRGFVNMYLRYNAAVTDDDRVNLGLRVPDAHPTPASTPGSYPVFAPDTSILMRVTLHIRDSAKQTRGKPAGVHGCEIRWAIRDSAPTHTEDLSHSAFTTKSVYTFEFDENQRGQRLYVRGRWENNRGEKGPWSEIVNATIA